MHVLVSGGAGYIGSHTAKALALAGHVPVVYDNLSTGHRWAVRWGPFVEGDLADHATLRQAIHDHRVEAAIHFAAKAYVGESMGNPRLYFRENVVNSLTLFDTLLDAGVEHIVVSSSCATYGHPVTLPLTEDSLQRPISPYGESKLVVERALGWYGQAYGLRWAALRYFNAAGADPAGDIGECHFPETHLIPLLIEAALGRGSTVDVLGTDYPTPDGTAIRDFIHVSDLAEAHVRALAYLADGGPSLALNLGTGRGHSVKEVVTAVARVGERPVPVRFAARRSGDPAELVADPSRAQAVLGWTARRSDLLSLIADAWSWHAAGHPR